MEFIFMGISFPIKLFIINFANLNLEERQI